MIFFTILGALFLSRPCEAAKGRELVVSYQVLHKENVTPSYCMAIWLEAHGRQLCEDTLCQ